MPEKQPQKRPPKDPNQFAKYLVDVTTGDAEKIEPPKKDSAAVELGPSRWSKKRPNPQSENLARQTQGNRPESPQGTLEQKRTRRLEF